MKFWIDCEWNSFNGSLISMALVGEDGREWYEVTHCTNPHPWVRENVIPNLGQSAISLPKMRDSLGEFLSRYDSIHLIADWPEDIARFCLLLISGPGTCIRFPRLSMEIASLDIHSAVPHNALHDARAIKYAYLERK